jgi:hypothetical protein
MTEAESAMRPVGTLYHPPAHQVQLLDRGAVHWSTFPTSPQDPEAGHDPSVG